MTPAHNVTVLVAEDPLIGKFLRALLGRYGYHVEAAPVSKALEMLRSGDLHPDLLITNTPEEFLPLADQIHVLYTAATPDADLASHFPHCRTLRKPFRNQELLDAVSSLVS